jgi:outer membrane protein OmpA-like peptidoglycan-associated protein
LLIAALLGAAALGQPAARTCPVLIVESFTILPFASGSAELSAQVRDQVDAWGQIVLSRQFPARVELTGQTDRVGRRRDNLRLSYRRAAAVRDHLVRGGIPAERISILATGEDRPLIETADGVAEDQNRIVWLHMLTDPREPGPQRWCPPARDGPPAL